jgi:hypothetical protein
VYVLWYKDWKVYVIGSYLLLDLIDTTKERTTTMFTTLEKAFAITDFDRFPKFMPIRYINFARIARSNAVSWRSILAIGFQLLKNRTFKF